MADPLPDHYKSLGLSSTATKDQIRTAYRKLVLTSHPDKCQDEKEKKRREPIFHAVQAAYECLYDDDLRKAYDHDLLVEASRKEYRPPPTTKPRAGPKTRSQSYSHGFSAAPPRPSARSPSPDFEYHHWDVPHSAPFTKTSNTQTYTTYTYNSSTGKIYSETKTYHDQSVPPGYVYNAERRSYDYAPPVDEEELYRQAEAKSKKSSSRKSGVPFMTRPSARSSKTTPPPESSKDKEKREKAERRARQEAEQAQRDRTRRAEHDFRTAEKNTGARSESPSPLRDEPRRTRTKVKRSTTTPNVSSTDEARRSRAAPDERKKSSSSSSKSKYDEQIKNAKEYVDRTYTESPERMPSFQRSSSDRYERSSSRPRFTRGFTSSPDPSPPRFTSSRSTPADIRIPQSGIRLDEMPRTSSARNFATFDPATLQPGERVKSATTIYTMSADGRTTTIEPRDQRERDGLRSATLPIRPKTAKSSSFMGFTTTAQRRTRAAAPGPIPLPRRMSSGLGTEYVMSPGATTPGGTRFVYEVPRERVVYANTPGVQYVYPATPQSPYTNPYVARSARSGVVR